MFHSSKRVNELLTLNNVKAYMNKKIFLLGVFLLLPVAQADKKDESDHPQTGSIWQLIKNGSNLSSGPGQVVYFLSSDAYHTYQVESFKCGIVFLQWMQEI